MHFRIIAAGVLVAIGGQLLIAVTPAMAEKRADSPKIITMPDGRVIADGVTFDTWSDYATSDFFRERGLRCGTVHRVGGGVPARGSSADCSYDNTDPAAEYDPSVRKYQIPVVVHVIQNDSGSQGFISEAMIQSQIDILNEDYLALSGSNGENGTDIQIVFYLATEEPDGSPTNGITYSNNTGWFNDATVYWETLAWDPDRYLNIYTNTAAGYLGYSFLPQEGIVGTSADRVVIYHDAFGRDSPAWPYNQGRTATHEVGHYLGLFHPFDFGCAGGSCYTGGDLICDTNEEEEPRFECPVGASSCGSLDPIRNYMDYTDDLCMTNFTPEQARRIRCTLEYWRPDLAQRVIPAVSEWGLIVLAVLVLTAGTLVLGRRRRLASA